MRKDFTSLDLGLAVSVASYFRISKLYVFWVLDDEEDYSYEEDGS